MEIGELIYTVNLKFNIGDYVWYDIYPINKRHFGRITQDSPSTIDFEITFLDGTTKWTKSWFLEHATNEEAMLIKLEN